MRVKVCGITRLEDAALAAELGAAALGFVFWPRSPRFIDPFRARRIVRELPPLVTAVGVFVDQPLEYVRGVTSLVRLGAVQLHGDEGAPYCEAVGSRVIKALALGPDGPVPPADAYPASVTVLLDAADPRRKGGTGRTVDWSAAGALASRRRVILAGGLRPENVAEAISRVRPYGIDVSSGVEIEPGRKSEEGLRELFRAIGRPSVPALPAGPAA